MKKEQGIDPIQKQVEDCQKAIWCIKDHVETIDPDHKYHDNDEQEIVCICENCALLDQYNNECKRAGILIKNPKKSSCNLFQKRDGGK